MSVTKDGRNQASRLEIQKRTEFAQSCFLKGLSSGKVNAILQKEFQLSQSGAQVYITKAHEAFQLENPEDRAKLRAKLQARLDDLYAKSYEKEHYKVCREIIESQAKLGGLHSPDESTSNAAVILNYSPIEPKE